MPQSDANILSEREVIDGHGRRSDIPDDSRFEDRPPSLAEFKLAALGEMTIGIAHDFKNVLAVIDASLDLAANGKHFERRHSYIAAAREGIARGVQLTDRLVTFAKQRDAEPEACDANELLRNLAPLLKYGAGAEISIALKLAPVIPKCLVDPTRFDAAILNLVINARDAMPNGGKIEITTERWAAKDATSDSSAPHIYVRVRVRDQGHGMSEDVIGQIFSPFFTTKGEKGTGLGVPQVCAFMHSIGGRLWVVSELGIGTVFDLFFPTLKERSGHV